MPRRQSGIRLTAFSPTRPESDCLHADPAVRHHLRDGTQSEGLSLSVEDKLRIARVLDGFGIHYIEGGYPGSNPKDIEFFRRARGELRLKQAKLTAFGSTRKAGTPPRRRSQPAGAGRGGHAGGVHLRQVLAAARDPRAADHAGREPGDDPGQRRLPEERRARRSSTTPSTSSTASAPTASTRWRRCKAAADAGADWMVLCDTNGGSLPSFITEVVQGGARPPARTPLGIHTHNDADMAVANALAAVEAGATQVQGTINGWGERCGNANLISIIPALQLKMGRRCVPDESLARLTELSRTVSEIANIRPRAHAPYVGASRLRPQGRRPRGRGREADRDLRAHRRPSGWATSARWWCPSCRAGATCACARSSWAPTCAGMEKDVLARVKELENRGLPVRGRRGLVRAAGPAHARRLPGAVRGAGPGGDQRAPPGQRHVRRGHGEAEGGRRAGARGGRGRRPGARAGPGVPQGAGSRTTRCCARSSCATTRCASSIPRPPPAPRPAC